MDGEKIRLELDHDTAGLISTITLQDVGLEDFDEADRRIHHYSPNPSTTFWTTKNRFTQLDRGGRVRPSMLLRDHPLMVYKGLRSWPPAWLWRSGNDNTYPKGEVGVLRHVVPSSLEPCDRCYLVMEHRGAEYIGALLLSDPAFCQRICAVLLQHRGKRIREIGDIDLTFTL